MPLHHFLPGRLGLTIILSLAATQVEAAFVTSITPSVTPVPGGLFLYEYLVSNEATSDLPAISLTLTVASGADIQAITGPAGWTPSYSTGDTFITWESMDATTDLLPGGAASFSFQSPLDPVLTDYLITGLDESAGAVDANTGQVLGPGPAAVPEPSSWFLLGVTTLLGVSFRRVRCIGRTHRLGYGNRCA